jgi:hypothetical protein
MKHHNQGIQILVINDRENVTPKYFGRFVREYLSSFGGTENGRLAPTCADLRRPRKFFSTTDQSCCVFSIHSRAQSTQITEKLFYVCILT